MNMFVLAVYSKMINNKVYQIIKVYDTSKKNFNLNPSLLLLKCNNIIQVDYYNYYGIHHDKEKIINEFVVSNSVGITENFSYLKQIIL